MRARQWIPPAVVAISVVGLAAIVVPHVLAKEAPLGVRIGLLAVGALVVVSILFRDGSLRPPRHWSGWARPELATSALLAVAAATSLLIDLRSLLEPQSAIEASPGELQAGVRRIETKLDGLAVAAPAAAIPASVASRFRGVWGEPGCALRWRIGVEGVALTAQVLPNDEGVAPYNFEGTIVGSRAEALEVRGENPAEAAGFAATFTHETNGRTETLRWDDRRRNSVLVLHRCA